MNQAKLKTDFVVGGYFPRTLSASTKISTMLKGDEFFMAEALVTAMNAIGWSSPNPSVGCVILKKDQIIARGFTQEYKKEHAERMAFKELERLGIRDLSDACAYVTLEPCVHQGNQPPCLDFFMNSNIRNVIIGCKDLDDRVSGRSIEVLTRAGKNVKVGILESECEAWHSPFLKTRASQKVFWAAKWAQSLNGFLAQANGDSKWISNNKSRAYTHWLRQKYDAILVGAGTWLQDQPALTVRDCAEPVRRHPQKLIYDPNGRLLSRMEALTQVGSIKVFVKKSVLKSHLFLAHLPRVDWVSLDDLDPIRSLIAQINNFSIQSVMVEGGARLLNELFSKNIFDLVHQFVAPNAIDDANNQFKLSTFDERAFFQISEQKIDDDYLREWSK